MLDIRTRCAAAVVRILPKSALSTLFASHEPAYVEGQVAEMLDCFEDPYINKHLLFAIVDLVFSRLFPEIQDQRISDLLKKI